MFDWVLSASLISILEVEVKYGVKSTKYWMLNRIWSVVSIFSLFYISNANFLRCYQNNEKLEKFSIFTLWQILPERKNIYHSGLPQGKTGQRFCPYMGKYGSAKIIILAYFSQCYFYFTLYLLNLRFCIFHRIKLNCQLRII